MNTKLQEITDKIYLEGVEKAKEASDALISTAKKEAEEIILSAKSEAANILTSAESEAIRLKNEAEAELRLRASQLITLLQTEISSLLSVEIANTTVQSIPNKENFLKELLWKMVEAHLSNEQFVLYSDDVDSLNDFLRSRLSQVVERRVAVKQMEGQKAHFVIQSVDKGYEIRIGEKELAELFSRMLRPQLEELLFKKVSL